MSKHKIILLSNIKKVFDEIDKIDQFKKSIKKERITSDEKQIKKLFSQENFIVSVINGDVIQSSSCFDAIVKGLNDTNFPALILASKANIRKYLELFPITVDFLQKPASRFDLFLRYNRIIQIYKIVKKQNIIKNMEKEISIRDNLLELTRKELKNG